MAAPPIERIFQPVAPIGRVGFVPTPVEFLLSGDDNLRVAVLTDDLGIRVDLHGRYLHLERGEVNAFSRRFVPTALYSENTFDVPMPHAVILNLWARAAGTFAQRGQCYVRVDVIRGILGNVLTLGTIMAGYVGSWGGIAWPGTGVEQPTEGRGVVQLMSSGAVAPGASPIIAMPPHTMTRVISAILTFTTDATVITRGPFLTLTLDANTVFRSESSAGQLASQSKAHSWGTGAGNSAGGIGITGHGSLPVDALLRTGAGAGASIGVSASFLQAGDQFSSLIALVEQWRSPITVFA